MANVQQDFPPAIEDIAEALEQLDEIKAEAEARMAQAQDPRDQTYIMRMDTKRLVKTEAEWKRCEEDGVPMRYGISYAYAKQLLKDEDAAHRAKIKQRKKQKAAKKAKKRNRKR